jgi:hypothetical protein
MSKTIESEYMQNWRKANDLVKNTIDEVRKLGFHIVITEPYDDDAATYSIDRDWDLEEVED